MKIHVLPDVVKQNKHSFKNHLLTQCLTLKGMAEDLLFIECVMGSIPGRVKTKGYKMHICHELAWIWLFGWLLEFYDLVTSKVILGWVMSCDSVHSWRLYTAASLDYMVASTMTRYPTQSYYSDAETTSPRPILIIVNDWLESD